MGMTTNRQVVTVRSSAGAGKTYNLALRYLRLLIPSPSSGDAAKIPQIVAITFTNKAASEMRSRIVEWMKRIILDIPFDTSSSSPVEDLAGAGLSETEKRAIRTVMDKNLHTVLHNFHDFKVSTIDSFVNLTLKASAFSLSLPPDFEISTDSSTFIEMVVQDMLQTIGQNSSTRETFDRFIESYISLEGENAGWNPGDLLRGVIGSFWQEETKENRSFASLSPVPKAGNAAVQATAAAGDLISYLDSHRTIPVHEGFMKALRGFSLALKEGKISDYFIRPTFTQSLRKGGRLDSDEPERLWQNIRSSLGILMEERAESKYAFYLEVYALFKKALRQQVTGRQRIVLIDQLNQLLQEIIGRNGFIPEIYYALSDRYLHFLIDEFQDTNRLQWMNMSVLIDEAISRGGTLFVVGDKKQAIYRWRGGTPDLVDEVIRQHQSRGVADIFLGENYRSCGQIVDFANAVFHEKMIAEVAEKVIGTGETNLISAIVDTYRDSIQNCLPGRTGEGYVWAERITDSGSRDSGSQSSPKERMQTAVTERFSTIVGEIRRSGAFRDRDIAVLVRTKSEAEPLISALLEAGIPVNSDSTVDLRNNPAIQELVSLLRFINDSDDDLSFAGFITGSLFRGRFPQEGSSILSWLMDKRISDPSLPLYHSFRNDYPQIWTDYFVPFFAYAGYLPLYDLVTLFFTRWAVFDQAPDNRPFFLRFAELITEREGTGENRLQDFVDFWNGDSRQRGKASQEKEASFLLKTTEGADAVRVMTIHKAKGLQFPVVIIPFALCTTFGASGSPDKNRYFVDDGREIRLLHLTKESAPYSPRLRSLDRLREANHLLDELNNLYVACTRAERELYILLPDSTRQKNLFAEQVFAALSPFASDGKQRLEMGHKTESPVKGSLRPGQTTYAENGVAAVNELDLLSHFSPAYDRALRKGIVPGDTIGSWQEQQRARRRGEAIHYILSLVDRLPEGWTEHNALDSLVDAGVARYACHSEKDLLRDSVKGIFANPSLAVFFTHKPGDTVLREQEITDDTGLTHKADRIVITGETVHVIEFKTGKVRHKAHGDQIALYGSLVKSLYPDKKVFTHLAYLDTGETVSS